MQYGKDILLIDQNISDFCRQSGVGCNTPMASTKELESNRTEILKLLLALSSKAMYMTASTLNYHCCLEALSLHFKTFCQ